MKFINSNTGLELIIGETLLEQIVSAGKEKYPKEFGGILLGRYINQNKCVLVEHTLLPKRFKSSVYFFERGSEGLKEALKLHYNSDPRLIYVGEWHTHPNHPAIPSLIDITAMQELANDAKVLIRNPVLIIIGLWKKRYETKLFFVEKNQLLEYDPADN